MLEKIIYFYFIWKKLTDENQLNIDGMLYEIFSRDYVLKFHYN